MNGIIATAVTVAQLVAAPPADAPSPRALLADRPPIVQPAPDAWLGRDKFQHFWVSYAATTFAFAAATGAGVDADDALLVAVPAAMVAGIGKEVFDRRQGRIFSLRDLVADALGTIAAAAVLAQIR